MAADGPTGDDAQAERAVLEGLISVEAALMAQSRTVERLYLQQDRRDRALAGLARRAEAQGVAVEWVDGAAIDQVAHGRSHGGVVALGGPRQLVALQQLIAGRPVPFVVMLDGIEDPFNFGLAVRALYAAGVDGLVVRPRNWMTAAGTVARASAGASEQIPTAVAESSAAAAAFFRSHGLAVACMAQERAVSLYAVDLTGPLFVLIGGEKRGITRSFRSQADLILQIPYGRAYTHALGTVSAASVLAFEVLRQRTSGSV